MKKIIMTICLSLIMILSVNNVAAVGLSQVAISIGSKFLLCTLITILIEMILSLLFGLKKYWKVILITNIATQILYNFMATIGEIPFLTLYIILQAIIVTIETSIYLDVMKDKGRCKILFYSFLGNVITGYFVNYVIFQLPL